MKQRKRLEDEAAEKKRLEEEAETKRLEDEEKAAEDKRLEANCLDDERNQDNASIDSTWEGVEFAHTPPRGNFCPGNVVAVTPIPMHNNNKRKSPPLTRGRAAKKQKVVGKQKKVGGKKRGRKQIPDFTVNKETVKSEGEIGIREELPDEANLCMTLV